MNIHSTCSGNPTFYVHVGILWVRKFFLSNVIVYMDFQVKKITQIVVRVLIVVLLTIGNWTIMHFISIIFI